MAQAPGEQPWGKQGEGGMNLALTALEWKKLGVGVAGEGRGGSMVVTACRRGVATEGWGG